MGPNTGRSTQRPASLPAIHTSLVGRRDAARQIAQLARSGTCRLITITGPGGMGKTRLAIHLAEHLVEDFPDGVIWVPLAAVAAPDLVVPTILQHLGVHEIPGIPPLDLLLEQVQHRTLLLVLDDLEHLLASAPDLRTIVMASKDLVMLVTSQAPLGVGGEKVYALPPLALPDPQAPPERLLQSEAVSLFVQRARAINPYLTISPDDADIIAAICIRLDGLPLAIELAAARTNVLTPRALLTRLDQGLNMLSSSREDLPDRLRTQRRAIAWSYGLLSEDEQRLFRWLSVFAGGIPLAAIDGFPTTAHSAFALDLLTQLVERSLVTARLLPGQDPRYEILEILRAFGHEQLVETGDDEEARSWHAAWATSCATEAGARVLDGGQMLAMETFGREMENIRVALGWFLHHGPPEPALAISSASARFWSMRGMATEGRSWIAQALAANGDEPSSLRAEAFFAAGCLAADQNDLAEADRAFATSLAIAEQVNDRVAASAALSGLGTVAHDLNDYDRALAWHEQAMAAALASGDRRSRAVAYGNMGAALFYQGDYERARTCWEDGVPVVQELGDRQGEAVLLSNLGALLIEMNDFPAARDVLERTLTLERSLDDVRSIGFCLTNLAEAYFHLGDLETPIAMLDESIRSFRASNNPHDAATSQILLARVRLARGERHDAISLAREALIDLGQSGDAASIAEASEVLAAIALQVAAPQEAEALLHGAMILRAHIASPTRPSTIAETEATRAAVQAALGPDALPALHQDALARPAEEITNDAIRIATVLFRLSVATGSGPDRGTASPAGVKRGAASLSIEEHEIHALSERELDVLRLLADGMSTREIADHLFIAPRTAATHVNNIIGKLGVSSRTAAVALALRLGIV